MRFTKMNGAGNDFIIVENLRGELDEQKLSKLARTLCDRRMSIGADGLMAVVPAKETADYGMLFFNCDGSLGEMCGNGARCICRYGYEHQLAGETQTIETTAGLVTGERIDARNYRRICSIWRWMWTGKRSAACTSSSETPAFRTRWCSIRDYARRTNRSSLRLGASSATTRPSRRARMCRRHRNRPGRRMSWKA